MNLENKSATFLNKLKYILTSALDEKEVEDIETESEDIEMKFSRSACFATFKNSNITYSIDGELVEGGFYFNPTSLRELFVDENGYNRAKPVKKEKRIKLIEAIQKKGLERRFNFINWDAENER